MTEIVYYVPAQRETLPQTKVWWTKTNESESDTNFFINVLGRAFKMIKNGVYIIVRAFLGAELLKILHYAN